MRNGFPRLVRQLSPEEKILGWRHPSQEPPTGVPHDPKHFPFYATPEACVNAAAATVGALIDDGTLQCDAVRREILGSKSKATYHCLKSVGHAGFHKDSTNTEWN